MAFHERYLSSDAFSALLVALTVAALLVAMIAHDIHKRRQRKQRRQARAARHRRQLMAWNFMMWTRRMIGLSTQPRLTDQRKD